MIDSIKRGKVAQWRPVVTHGLTPKKYLREENVKGFIEATQGRIKVVSPGLDDQG